MNKNKNFFYKNYKNNIEIKFKRYIVYVYNLNNIISKFNSKKEPNLVILFEINKNLQKKFYNIIYYII